MRLEEIDALLDPTPLPLEVGYERLDNGVLHVATRTDMHRCTGRMLEWWFRSRPNTQQYVWWHPVDHFSSAWTGGAPDSHIGSMHTITEKFTDGPIQTDLRVQFRDPREFFNEERLAAAIQSGAVTGIVVARLSAGVRPPADTTGALLGGRLIHLGRDTTWGMVLRSHFFLGQDLPGMGLNTDEVIEEFPDDAAAGLIQHAYNEFTFLSRFLPSLYIGDNRDSLNIEVPW